MARLTVALVFGGKSTEHEISLQSARSILAHIDQTKYDIALIGISKEGEWSLYEENYLSEHTSTILPQAHRTEISFTSTATIVNTKTNLPLRNVDVVFPVMHGTFGEDGTIQGVLKSLGLPFVGADVLGSAIGMDKDVAKRLLRDANIPIARFYALTKNNRSEFPFSRIQQELGTPVFIKPANAGSSVGVHKVLNEAEYRTAMEAAFQFDKKILIEEAIVGRELECAVLGNEKPLASVVGEVIVNDTFYSYEAKYVNADGARLEIPARITTEVSTLLQRTALKAFNVLCCEGLARVDFFLKSDNSLVLNEINTMPGFTTISMYSKLWEASGLWYGNLIDTLIQLAIERHNDNQLLRTSV